jgi:hypothetical protein
MSLRLLLVGMAFGALIIYSILCSGPAFAADIIHGQVLGAGAPIVRSTVTLWAAGTGAPQKLDQKRTDADGRFEMVNLSHPAGAILYLVAQGGQSASNKAAGENPAIALMAVVGSKAPGNVTVNELTTVASVWTNAQFLNGPALRGGALGLRIAAGNVPNFVNLTTGGLGGAIQDPLNSSQTPTMANFATLGTLLAGCTTQVTASACKDLFAAAASPTGKVPTDTLAAAESIARYSWYNPEKLFALLDEFYPFPKGKNLRATPYEPYLSFAPSAWVLALKFDGGGYIAGGKMMFNSEGDLWVVDNFTVGYQGQDTLWQGHITEFAPNGSPISPITTGFYGGGMEGGTFGQAIDANDNVWADSYGGQSISVFDKHGKPLTPPDGITFNGQLGLMQGIIVAPNGDVWVLGVSKNQLVYFPKGDQTKGRIICQGFAAEPCKSMVGPFHLAIDQQDRIWVSNALGDAVTRFPASDPTKVQTFKAGYSQSGLAVDSQGYVWVTNRLGSSARGAQILGQMLKAAKTGGNFDEVLTVAMSKQTTGDDGGSMTLFRPDGTEAPGSPFTGPYLPGPWAVVVDGDDQVWISDFAAPWGRIAHLCGTRPETCPPGMKTGDPISPPGGYVGGGLQMQVDIALDPAGNIWVGNNWQDIDQCFATPPIEALSTRCGGQGVTVFYGMAKPLRTPLIGPPRAP